MSPLDARPTDDDADDQGGADHARAEGNVPTLDLG